MQYRNVNDCHLFSYCGEQLAISHTNMNCLLFQQEELTEEQKAVERAKPVSSTPVPGTPW